MESERPLTGSKTAKRGRIPAWPGQGLDPRVSGGVGTGCGEDRWPGNSGLGRVGGSALRFVLALARHVGAQVSVRGLRVFSDFELEFRMALTNKRLASDIEVVCLITSEEHTFLSSSTVKEVASLRGDVSGMVPDHVARAMKDRFSELGDDGRNSVPVVSLRD